MADKELLKQIGERIAGRRKALHLTQERLAEMVGVSTQMISNLECGKKAIRPENMLKICDALNISADYVLNVSGTDNGINDIITKLVRLTPQELELVNEVIDYMTKKK